MRAEISYYRQGDQVDCYEPTSNALACFKGRVEDVFKQYIDQHYFVVYLPAYQHSESTWHGLMGFLTCHIEQVIKIRAYSNLTPLGEDTYIQLQLIPEPKDV